MKIELVIIIIAGFLIYNAYHNGKYTKLIMSWKKYIQMGTIALIAISLYLMIKRNPTQTKSMLLYANNAIKYMPIDKSSMDLITPIFDFTTTNKGFMENANAELNPGFDFQSPTDARNLANERKILLSGQKATKRSVSETKKKYVASMQDWKCGHCSTRLNAWFEVDHKVRLEHGGGNEVQNLVALCRECHGKKTAMENM